MGTETYPEISQPPGSALEKKKQQTNKTWLWLVKRLIGLGESLEITIFREKSQVPHLSGAFEPRDGETSAELQTVGGGRRASPTVCMVPAVRVSCRRGTGEGPGSPSADKTPCNKRPGHQRRSSRVPPRHPGLQARTWTASARPRAPSKSKPTSAVGRLMNTNDRPVPRRGVFNTSHVSVTLSDHLPKPGSGSPSVPRRAARR